jgi:splicing factor 3A subunit 3
VSLAVALLFSGEEAYGKYVDLYTNHTAYNNLKNIGKRLGYLQYLDVLLLAQNGSVHRELPKETRLTKDYESYVQLFQPPTWVVIIKKPSIDT